MSSVLQPWQLSDLNAMDAAWIELATGTTSSQPVVRRAYVERPRGHSKTSDMAVQIAWILLAAQLPVNGIAAAADRDQATFLRDSIRRLSVTNPELFADLEFIQHAIKNRVSGSRIDFVSSDAGSSYGALPDFVVCDELSHWRDAALWHSLFSSAAKKQKCVLVILTNAGVGRGWQWEIREHARTGTGWYFSSLDGPQAPWISQDWLAEQRALLPQPVYERLWLNRWQQAEGNFLTLQEVEQCRDTALSMAHAGLDQTNYIATIDYAEKHDFTVGCLCHLDQNGRVIVDRMDVIKPSPQTPTPIAWVESWMESVAQNFKHVRFVVDEYQLIGTIQKYESRYAIERFEFAGVLGHHKLAVLLRQLILQQRVRWFPDCGAVQGDHRDDLETELASLILRQSVQGRVRIDHIQDGQHHDDRAFALGVACLKLNESAHSPYLEIQDGFHENGFEWRSF